MNFIEEFKNLFKKNLAKKPMSIKDDRVAKVQEILGQVAALEDKPFASYETLDKNRADWERDDGEIRIRLRAGVRFDAPEIEELSQNIRRCVAYSKGEKQKREYHEDIKQIGRFLLDPLTPEEKQAKQAKQAIAKQEKQSEKTRKARLARFDKQPKKGVKM